MGHSRRKSSRSRSRSAKRLPKHSHKKHSSSSESSRHKHSPRYKFDSPPRSYLEYTSKVWTDLKSTTNPEDFISKIQQVGSTIASAQAHKIDRELYIGNLPAGISQQQLVDILNSTMQKMGLQQGDGEPVLAAWISNDGHYAFIEFRSIEEAKLAYKLDNVNIMGQPIKVGRPKTYAGNQPVIVSGLQALQMSAVGLNKVTEEMASKILGGKGRLMISGIPHGYQPDELRKIMSEYGTLLCFDMPKDVLTGLTKGYAIYDYEEDENVANILQMGHLSICGCQAKITRVGKESLTLAFLPPTPELENKAKFTSRILVLRNMTKITDLEHDEDYQDLHEDVVEECNKYGRVISIIIPRPGEHTSGIGKIFVEFACVEDAIRAKAGLSGLKFNEKRVECSFHPEELFFQGNFKGD